MFTALLVSIAACGIAYAIVRALRLPRIQRHLMDIPNERSSHSLPTPRGGGLAVALVVLLGDALAALILPGWRVGALAGYLLGGLLIASISLVDDVRSLGTRSRMLMHIIAAVLLLVGTGGWRVVTFPFVGNVDLWLAGGIITLIWVVGLTNAYNFMDGIDGLAGSQALIGGLTWAVLGGITQQPVIATLGLLLCGASAGFLGHNWPPARIFMGDVGSAFIGFTFAALPVLAAVESPVLAVAGALVVWPFLFDAGWTFVRRWRRGENVFAAHRTHFYQRLVISGLPHRHVTLGYAALASSGAVLALLWSYNVAGAAVLALLVIPALAGGLGWYVNRREAQRAQQPPMPIAPVEAAQITGD